MSKELDIQIAVDTQIPDVQIGLAKPNRNIQMNLEKCGTVVLNGNYETLQNLPQVNDVVVIGNKTNQDLRIVLTDTKAHWDAQLQYIPDVGQIIVYSDYYGEDKPAAKIGDGQAYLIDLPVVGAGLTLEIMQALAEHKENMAIHVTTAEKEFWNNKLNAQVLGETMILNRS